MTGPGDVPPEILDQLRPICRGLPETVEQPAWIGVRWRIRSRTFAHVYTVEGAGQANVTTDGPVCVVTFRAALEELAALVGSGYPFFRAAWGDDVVWMVLDERTDWAEVAELLTESYRRLAPKRLAARIQA